MDPHTVANLLTLWRKVRDNHANMGQTILELVSHPDVTPDMLAEPIASYRKVTASVQEVRRQVAKALDKKGHSMGANSVRAHKFFPKL